MDRLAEGQVAINRKADWQMGRWKVKLSYPDNKHILLSSVYRSNGPILNVTQNQQIESFFNKFSELLENLQSKRLELFVFIDSS